MEEEYVNRRIQALESELELLKRRVTMPKLSEQDVRKRIQDYRSFVREISKSLNTTEDPDTYIAKLRAKEY